jgi:hypothetical protein
MSGSPIAGHAKTAVGTIVSVGDGVTVGVALFAGITSSVAVGTVDITVMVVPAWLVPPGPVTVKVTT